MSGYPGNFTEKALAVIHTACGLSQEKGEDKATVADLEEAIKIVMENIK